MLRSRVLAAVGAATVAAGGYGSAQDRPAFSVGTSAVLLDVVVRDKNGAVRGLTPADFEVFEDGVKQAVTSVRVVDRGAGPARAASGTATAGARTETPAAAADAPARETTPAVVAFVFDRMSVEGRKLSHAAALSYAGRADAPEDYAGVFAIDLALQTVQPFTTSRDALRAGLDRAAQQGSTRFASDRAEVRDRIQASDDARTQLEALGAAGAGDPSVQARAQLLSLEMRFQEIQAGMLRMFDHLEREQQGFASTNGLLAVVGALQSIPGRKTVVFFSEGLAIPAAVQAQFRSVIDLANRASVAVYTMDAAGLRAESTTDETRKEMMQAAAGRLRQEASGQGAGLDVPMTRALERNEDLLRLNPQSGLGQLAEETGGFLIRDTNDATLGFRRIAEDMRFHYVLAYTPANDTWDGRFRTIAVKVLRPGVDVQTRRGYFAVRSDTVVPVRPFEAPALAHLDRTPRPSAFPIHSAAFGVGDPGRIGLASIYVEVPGTAVTYVDAPGAARSRRADFTVLVRLRDRFNRVARRVSQHYEVTVPLDRLDAARRGDILFYREVQVPPGRYTADAVVYDALADRASVRSSEVEVMETIENAASVSSLVLIKRREKLPPSERQGSNPLIYGETLIYPNLGEPLRKSATPAVGFFINVYGAKRQLKATLDLLQAGRSFGAIAVELPPPDAAVRVQYAGSIPLQAFARGAHTLKLTIDDGGGPQVRTIDFEVVE